MAPAAHSTGCLTSSPRVSANAGSVNSARTTAAVSVPRTAAGRDRCELPNRAHSRSATNVAAAGWSTNRRTYDAASKSAVTPRIVFGPGSCRRGRKTARADARSTVHPVSARAPALTSASV